MTRIERLVLRNHTVVLLSASGRVAGVAQSLKHRIGTCRELARSSLVSPLLNLVVLVHAPVRQLLAAFACVSCLPLLLDVTCQRFQHLSVALLFSRDGTPSRGAATSWRRQPLQELITRPAHTQLHGAVVRACAGAGDGCLRDTVILTVILITIRPEYKCLRRFPV